MNAFLLGAIICFDCWQESASRKYLFGAWAFFLLGIFTKEHVYIFPAFALAAALWKQNARVARRQVLLHVALMGTVVLALWFYRASIIIDPRNPQLKPIHLLRKPWLYLFYPFYKSVLCEEFWFAGLPVFIFSLSGVLIRWRNGVGRAWLQKPMMPVAIFFLSLGLVAAYCGLTYGSAFDAAWYLFEPANQFIRLHQLAEMLGTFYALWLLWKYRKTEPTLLAFAFLALSYLPVITYLGWHYTVAAWFVRCAYWAVVFQCAWLDVGPVLRSRVPPRVLRVFQSPPLAGFLARPKSSPA